MREIKFKFYDKKTKKLVETANMWWNYIEYLNEDEVIVCQFTGLTDKNGKEIYEGDIVSNPFNNYIVEFKSGAFWFKRVNENEFDSLLDDGLPKEILGNIYENPELLKDKGEE